MCTWILADNIQVYGYSCMTDLGFGHSTFDSPACSAGLLLGLLSTQQVGQLSASQSLHTLLFGVATTHPHLRTSSLRSTWAVIARVGLLALPYLCCRRH